MVCTEIYTITFCNTTNVGAALQEYALQRYLQLMGHHVIVINYIPKIMASSQSLFIPILEANSIQEIVKTLLLFPIKIRRKVKFWKFSNQYINLSSLCRNEKDIERLIQPDYYIVGSDQIWNDELVNWEKGYFLEFQTSAKKIAYAASAGKDEFSLKFLQKLKGKVEKFDKISVREDNLEKSLKSIDLLQVKQVLDPVFLLPKEHYQGILKRPKVKNYILLYEAEINEECILVARKLKEKYGLKIVQINRINNRYGVDRLYPCVSPTEFLGLVQYADFVVTNSFHAVAISLILEKQFWVIKLKKRFSRLESILKIVQCKNRIIDNTLVDLEEKINYTFIKERLISRKNESIKFLDSIFKEKEDDEVYKKMDGENLTIHTV